MNSRNLKLTLAYDGTRFVGWQRQSAGESIQGLVEAALSALQDLPVTVHGAGRTDAGVHALAQVASASVTFTHDTSTVRRALNARLPSDIRVLDVEDAPDGFHARFNARAKSYRYLIANAAVPSPFDRAFAWHVPEPLDVDAMDEAAAMLLGTHDFAAFQSTGSEVATTVRSMTRSEVRRNDQPYGGAGSIHLTYEIDGNGFLRHMVRTIVGTLVEIGCGSRPPGEIRTLLEHGSRAQAGATAPPHGLFLVRVEY